MRIIDVHGHWGPWPFHLDVGDVSLNIELMDRYGIDLQVVSAAEAVVYDAVKGNAALAEVLINQPRLFGYAVVNPNRLERSAEDLRDCLSTGRFLGAKIHTTYPGVTIGEPLMADAFDMLDEANVPLLLHTWGKDVALLPGMLENRPNLRVIVGHAAWRRMARGSESRRRLRPPLPGALPHSDGRGPNRLRTVKGSTDRAVLVRHRLDPDRPVHLAGRHPRRGLHSRRAGEGPLQERRNPLQRKRSSSKQRMTASRSDAGSEGP